MEKRAEMPVCSHQQHSLIKMNPLLWAFLPRCGQGYQADEVWGEVEPYEVRNCVCGSTLYKRLDVGRA